MFLVLRKASTRNMKSQSLYFGHVSFGLQMLESRIHTSQTIFLLLDILMQNSYMLYP